MSETAIGIDIGGSHVECGIVCDDRVIVSETIKVKSTTFYSMLESLEALIRSFLINSETKSLTISGIAVGISAIVDQFGSISATNGKYDDGVGFNFGRWSEQIFGLRCVAVNDARLALLGEHHVGAAKNFDDVVLVTLGTGIGGAVLLGGKLLCSKGGKAGGLAGHLGVDWRGRISSRSCRPA